MSEPCCAKCKDSGFVGYGTGTEWCDQCLAGATKSGTELAQERVRRRVGLGVLAGFKSLTPSPSIGETWWVKLPGATTLTGRKVLELSNCTAVLAVVAHSTMPQSSARYARTDITFVERKEDL